MPLVFTQPYFLALAATYLDPNDPAVVLYTSGDSLLTAPDWTATGSPTLVPGQTGSALRFGSTGFYTSATIKPFKDLGIGNFTFEFFVRINTLGSIGDHDYVCFDMYPLQAGLGSDLKFYFANYGQGWASFYSNASLKTNGEWVHVAITREAGRARMFFDGVLVADSMIWNNINMSQTGDFKIGARAGNVRSTTGNWDIDELRMMIGKAEYTAPFTPPHKQ